MKEKILILLCLILFLLGCQWSEDRYIQRHVTREELTGHFVGTPFAMESLEYAGFREHLIPSEHFLDLRDDGTCRAQTFVDVMIPEPDGGGKWISSDSPCRWAFGSDGSHQELDVSVRDELGAEENLRFYFDEQDGHLYLWSYAADPDAWKYMELRKTD